MKEKCKQQSLIIQNQHKRRAGKNTNVAPNMDNTRQRNQRTDKYTGITRVINGTQVKQMTNQRERKTGHGEHMGENTTKQVHIPTVSGSTVILQS